MILSAIFFFQKLLWCKKLYFLINFCSIFSAAIKGPDFPDIEWEPAVRMYRGMLVIFIMIGLLGINVHGWRRAGVNHVLIFEIDPRNHLTYVQFLMVSIMCFF